MQVLLLSGGSGKRLWPLSNEIRSKQFLKIFKSDNGELESMVERMYRSIKAAMPNVNITVATGKNQVSSLLNQLGDEVNVCIEPDRRDTFPAISLAAAFLKDKCGIDEKEAIVVVPVDPYVEPTYFDVVRSIGEAVEKDYADLVLMGIKPSYPSEKYGYIIADKNGSVSAFKEKPDIERAKDYLSKGAYWNGGVFGFKLGYMLDKAHLEIEFETYDDLYLKYSSLEKISIDYAVVEKEKNAKVIPYNGAWMDVGTWKTMTDVMAEKALGNVIMADTCENTHVLNEMDMPILAMGLKDVVVAASADGILVADKHQSSYMKPYVEKIEGPTMYAEKSWGSYKVLDIEEGGMTVKVTLLPGHSMNYHSHEHRDEIWTVIEGEGSAIIDGIEKPVNVGDVISLKRGCKHMLTAKTQLKVMEVQVGTDISVKDKIKHEL